jgi:hypothetical protein
MLHWITEVRRWLVLAVILAGIAFTLTHYCFRSGAPPQRDEELIEEALQEGWGVDMEPGLVHEGRIEEETGLESGNIESTTTAEFQQPVKSIDVVVSDRGDVLITGYGEVAERLPPIRLETLRARPRPEPWLKRDLGIALGVCWNFDDSVEPCLRIQTFRWFGSVTAPDPVFTMKYAGVSVNLPLRLGPLKNTSIGGTLKWDYSNLNPLPDVAITLTVQL